MISKRQMCLCAIAALLIAAFFPIVRTTVSGQQGRTVQYVYDENGRLRAVISPSGETTVYAYDAAGNIVSVTKRTTPLVNISGFSPTGARVGATVTIFGSGFSSNPAEDTVSFNGTAANIVSATVSQITTSVPTNATTGPITVVSPNGSANSRTDFVVRPELEITSFDPTIGIPDDRVTVTGIGFDATPQNDTLMFNGFPASIDSASSEQIIAAVPSNATSGHLSITTAGGTALSNGDFFVPPQPHTVDEVGFTGRIVPGEIKPVAIDSGRIGLIVFDGMAGQKVAISTNNVTFDFVLLTLSTPSGANVFTTFVGKGNHSVTPVLPASGTYTIVIETFGNAGAMNLGLTQITDVAAPISPDGPPVIIALATPGQTASLSFNGTAGQKVSLLISNVTIPSGDVTLVGPDGTLLADTFLTTDPNFAAREFLDAVTLPDSGLYRILVEPFGQTGVATFALYNVVDLSTAIVVDGDPVEVTTVTPGQNARITFEGTAGQNLNLSLSSSSLSRPRVSIYNPDGTILIPPTIPGDTGGGDPTFASLARTGRPAGANIAAPPPTGSGNGDVGISNLPQTGVYTILLDPSGPSVGSVTLKLITVTDVTGSVTIDGSPSTIATNFAGQNARVTFSGAQDQRVFIALTDMVICQSFVSVNNPDGSTLVDPVVMNTPGGAVDIHNLPFAGTYSIFIEPTHSCKGDVTIQASSTGSIAIGGTQVTTAFTTPGQTASLTFNAETGRRVRVNTRDVSIPSGSISILAPDNSVVFTGSIFGFSRVELPVTGTYTLVVDPEGNTGSITINLNSSSGGSGD